MSLAYPSFLIFSALISIPILLHLWSLKRAKVEYFSNIALLKNLAIVSSKTSRIKHLLLLCTRVAFVLFLTLAFAKLYNQRKEADTGKSNVKLKIDNSCSVMSSDENKGKVNRILPNSSEENELINSQETFQDCNLDAITMSGYLDKRSIENEGGAPIALISDFQMKFVDIEKIKNLNNDLFLVLLKSQNERPNVCVDSAWITNAYLKQNSDANEIKVRLRNTGENVADRIVIELKVDKATIASQMVSIEAKSYLTIPFRIENNVKGDIFCQLKIDDGSWTFDNVFDFVLTPTKHLPIVLVAEEAQNNPVKIAYDQEETFQCKLLKDDKGGTDFMTRTDLFVLEKQSEPNKTFLHTLFEEVRKGKSMVVFVSDKWEKGTIDFINKELGKVIMDKLVLQEKSMEMEAPDVRNPFFVNMFENVAMGTQLPSITPTCLLKGVDDVLLKTKSGNVALGEYRIGNGKVFVFPFGLGNGETFSRNAIFLPVLYRIAESSAKNKTQPYRRVGDRFLEFECDSCNEADLYSLQNGSLKIIPEQKRIGNKVQMFLQDNLALGFWNIHDKQGSKIASFGLNPNLQESEMSFYSLQELRDKFLGNERVKCMSFEEFSGKVMGMDNKDSPSNVWRYVVAICFLFLLLEILIAKYFKKITVSGV